MAAVNHTRHAAAKRLLADAKELQDSPVAGISAVPLEDNLFKWHCNMLCKDLPFHVILTIPENYPFRPPEALFMPFGLKSPDSAYDHSGAGMIFCISLLSEYERFHDAEQRKEAKSGWSPGYTIQSVLINLGSYLFEQGIADYMDNRMLLTRPGIPVCPLCGHTTEKPYPPLPEQSVYPDASSDANKRTPSVTCYISKQTLDPNTRPASTKELFGVGLNCTGPVRRPFWSSPCQTLTFKSFRAMEEVGPKPVSVVNEKIAYFLPLVLHQAPNIQTVFESAMESMYVERKQASRKLLNIEDMIMDFLPNLMTTTLESFCGARKGSGPLLAGLFQFYPLFLWADKTYPGLHDKINDTIKNFLQRPERRHKHQCPHLQEWLMLLLMTSSFSWWDVADVFLTETLRREVTETVKVEPRVGDPAENTDYVLQKQFNLTKSDKGCLAFQVAFINIAKPRGFDCDDVVRRLDENLGFPTPDMEAEVRRVLELSRGVKNYSDWYKMLQLSVPTLQDLYCQILDAVAFDLETAGYHSESRSPYNSWRRLIQKKKRQEKGAANKRTGR